MEDRLSSGTGSMSQTQGSGAVFSHLADNSTWSLKIKYFLFFKFLVQIFTIFYYFKLSFSDQFFQKKNNSKELVDFLPQKTENLRQNIYFFLF
jgi:hypothetical protein